MPNINEIIDQVSRNNIPTNVATGEKVDPYTLEGKMNLILKYLSDIKKDDGTQVNVAGVFQQIIDFIDDPQAQLDALEDYCNSLDATKAGSDVVDRNTNNIADLGANKQDAHIIKYEGSLYVTDMDDFRTQAYEQRKSPTRTWQFEASESVNQDLMDILGWPEGNGKSAFIYVTLPYSEAGGFEIDITYMNRTGAPIYKRTMTSTLNANWKDTGWVQYATVFNNSNPNLLINPDFKINQRGQTSYSNDYTVDRWKLTSGTLTVQNNGILLNGTLEQYVENMPTGTKSASIDNPNATIQIISNGIKITASNQLIKWVKLELGTVATKFEEPEPITELLKCRRYFQKVRITTQFYASSASVFYPAIETAVPMYKKPTIIIKTAPSIRGNGSILGEGIIDGVSDKMDNQVILRCLPPTGTYLKVGEVYMAVNGELVFDAEL